MEINNNNNKMMYFCLLRIKNRKIDKTGESEPAIPSQGGSYNPTSRLDWL